MWSRERAGTPPLLVQTGWVLSPILCCQSGEVGVPHCMCSAVVQVSPKDVEFKRVHRRHALKEAVLEEIYPPSITVKAVHSKVPEHLRCPRFIHLLISGTKSGQLTFPVEVSEEKECEFVILVCGV